MATTPDPSGKTPAGTNPAASDQNTLTDCQPANPLPSHDEHAVPTLSESMMSSVGPTGVVTSQTGFEMNVAVGTELGYYRLLKKLGEGGMGSVWLAVHTKLEKQVAVKVLPAKWNNNAALLARFEREMKAVGKLEHPHIVRAMDAGEFNGTHYLVMEFNEGQDLSAWVKQRGPQTVKNACEMIRHAAVGLIHAHAAGLIHRDIKPNNLFLTKQGKVKILDLGLALVQGDDAGDGQTLTGFGQVLGTPDYMAPEQWENTHLADARSDLYALGCTLFYLLTGRAPFADEQHKSMVGKMKGHTLDQIPDLKAARREAVANKPKLANDLISDELDALYSRLMAKRPEDRFASAEELAQALTAFGATSAGASSVPGRSPNSAADASPAADGSAAVPPQRDSSTKPLLMTEFESETPTEIPSSFNDPTQTAFGNIPAFTHVHTVPASAFAFPNETSASETTSATRDKPVPACALGSRLKLGLMIGGTALVLLVGFALVKSAKRDNASINEVAQRDSTDGAASEPRPQRKKQGTKVTTEFDRPRSDESPDSSTEKPVVLMNPTPSTPEPTKPAPAPTTPSTTTTKPVPETATATEGRTLIVGVNPGEVADLAAAISQANPGDTILIRHRGPLEFAPVDLTGKTPLTIAGDVKGGVDYWPILRQSVLPDGSSPPTSSGLFFGKNLQLTFRKLHLGVGGQLRHPIGAAFYLDGGKLEFVDCTITVSGTGRGIDPLGTLIPLVQCAGTGSEPLDLRFQRTFVRGGRLNGCLSAVQPGPIQIVADQFLWAGAAAPWLTLQECSQPCRVQLEHTTLYNLGGLASAALTERKAEAKEPLLTLHVEHCLFTGPRVASPPLLQISAPGVSTLTEAVTNKWIEWKGSTLAWHQITDDDKTTIKGASPSKAWCQLFGLDERSLVVADPMFRVRPNGVELQDATVRDFQHRFARATKKPPRDADLDVGPAIEQLPTALACINSRNPATEALANVPRGAVRVLKVHQKDGPFQKLEDAISKVQSDDVIEIADNGVYVPTRNFAIGSAQAVLQTESAECLTIRAVDDSQAVIVLRDDVQKGTLPIFHFDARPERDFALYLLFVDHCRSLSLEGLHFRTVMSNSTRHSFIFQAGSYLRITNCTFVDASTAPPAIWRVYKPNRFFCQKADASERGEAVTWLENDAFIHPAPLQELPSDPRSAETFGHAGAFPHGVARSFLCRNCLIGSNMIAVSSSSEPVNMGAHFEVVSFERCTILGRVLFQDGIRSQQRFLCSDNLVIAPDRPVITDPPDLVAQAQIDGSGNAYWQTRSPLRSDERTQGALRLFPGPSLKTAPTFGGNATAADPLKPFRLKPGPPLDRMATDGGSVGVRFEYLPELPPFRPESSKRVK